MSHFVRNNIRYRSAASKALEGYYNSKAFILNELVKKESQFGENAKEILLLLFNKHADWLFHTEALLLGKEKVSESDVQLMQEDLRSVSDSVNAILEKHTEVFDPEYIRHWRVIHGQKFVVLLDMIKSVNGMPRILAFPFATECLVEYLNSTLFEIYELDCLLGSDLVNTKLSDNMCSSNTLVLHIDDISVQYSEKTKQPAEIVRLQYYLNNILKESIQFPVVIRNYVWKASEERSSESILADLQSALMTFSCVTSVDTHSTS